MGKKAAAWIEERNQWIQDNPPEYNGKWRCYLRTTPLCPEFLDIDQLTLDHEIPRSSLKNMPGVKTKLRPACVFCNGDKGSQSLENYLKSKGLT